MDVGQRGTDGILYSYAFRHQPFPLPGYCPQYGDILWERLVWRRPDYPVSLEVRQNEEVYKPFSPIVLDMKLSDRHGNPCNAYFSLAVHDRNSELNGKDCGIAEDLLLSSDLESGSDDQSGSRHRHRIRENPFRR